VNAQQAAGLLARRYRATLAAAAAVTVVLGFGATQLYFDTSQNGLIGSQSQVAKDNVRRIRGFGSGPSGVDEAEDIPGVKVPVPT